MNPPNILRVPLILGLLASLMVLPAPAPLPAGTDVWTEVSVANGVVRRWRVYTSLFGGKQTVNVIEVDLNNPHITIRPIEHSSCTARTSVLASGAGAVAAINGGFFGGCDSVSMIKINGTVSATNPGYKPARSTFGVNHTTRTVDIDWISSTNSWSAMDNALGAGPNLVTAGASNVTWSQEGFDSSYLSKNPRTAIGYTSANKVLLVTVDGRTSAGVGMTLSELATYMTWLGAVEAVNMDGGGSTTAWTSTQGVVNTPSDGSERSVVSALGVFHSGGFIVDNGTSGYAEVGTWSSSANAGFYGSNSRWTNTGTDGRTATWTPNVSHTAKYEVYAWWVAGSNRANNALYTIHHRNGSNTVPANQTINGGGWRLLGTYDFQAGTGGRVVLSNNAQASKVVSADAIRLLYKGPASPLEVITDNTDPGFTASSNWWTSTGAPGYLGSNFHVRGTAAVSDSATWSQTLPTSGSYKVYARWAAASNRATAAPYWVYHNGGSTQVNMNQTINGGTWVLLGTFNFNAGTAGRVALSPWTTSGQFVCADAVRFVLD